MIDWMDCLLPALKKIKIFSCRGEWLYVVGPPNPINQSLPSFISLTHSFHFTKQIKLMKRRAAGAEHKKRELPNWTGAEAIEELLKWNVKAGEEPPAHNPLYWREEAAQINQPINSARSMNAASLIWLISLTAQRELLGAPLVAFFLLHWLIHFIGCSNSITQSIQGRKEINGALSLLLCWRRIESGVCCGLSSFGGAMPLAAGITHPKDSTTTTLFISFNRRALLICCRNSNAAWGRNARQQPKQSNQSILKELIGIVFGLLNGRRHVRLLVSRHFIH